MVTNLDLDQAAAILRTGGIVALPTETVYGLGGDALNSAAVARIYAVKGRPATSPLIVHVADSAMARALTTEWPPEAEALAERYWPGPLTLVLPKSPQIPDIVTAGLPTVAIRVPAHPIALEIIRRAGTPIAAPSANRFTEVSPTTAQHVRDSFGSAVDLILDGGPCEVGIESTVVAVERGAATLLRPGIITQAEVEAVIGHSAAVAGSVEGAHPSPGMHARHYSPRTPVIICNADELPTGRGAYLYHHRPAQTALPIGLPGEARGYAQALYSALREADQANLDWIAIEPLPGAPEWAGLRDRVSRAAQR